jgi:hypothetical protein
VIQANKVMASVVGEVVRKAPLTDEKVAFAWRLAVGPQIDHATTVRLAADGTLHVAAESHAWIDAVHASIGLIRSRLAHLLGEDRVKQVACRTTRHGRTTR